MFRTAGISTLLFTLVIGGGCQNRFTINIEPGIFEYNGQEKRFTNEVALTGCQLTLEKITKDEFDNKNSINVIQDYSVTPNDYYSFIFSLNINNEGLIDYDAIFEGKYANAPNNFHFNTSVISPYSDEKYLSMIFRIEQTRDTDLLTYYKLRISDNSVTPSGFTIDLYKTDVLME